MAVPFIDTLIPNGPFPITRDLDILGGFRVVANVVARNALDPSMRVEGMLVYTLATQETWRLVGGILDANWAKVQSLSAPSVETLTYAGSVVIDMDPALSVYRTLALTGDVTFTTANRGAGRVVSVRLVADGSPHNLTFPAGVVFIGAAAPVSLAANKTAQFSFVCNGTLDSDIVAAYSAEP